MRHRWLAPIAAMMFAITTCSAMAVQRYELVDLGTLGGSQSWATKINNAGMISGIADDEGGRAHPVVWNGGAAIDLLPLMGVDLTSEAHSRLDFTAMLSVNNQGVMAGSARDGDGPLKAYVWGKAGVGLLPTEAGVGSFAYGMNDSGQVAGWIADSEGVCRAILWDGSDLVSLGDLGGGYAQAVAVNSIGQVVGGSQVEIPMGDGVYKTTHAFIWQNGAMTDLGTICGSYSMALDINDQGQVVGCSDARGPGMSTEIHAFLWQGGQMVDLGALKSESTPMSLASAVNSSAQVVGASMVASVQEAEAPQTRGIVSRAFIWQNGAMHDLNKLTEMPPGWELMHATDINDSGLIVGMGSYTQDGAHAATTRAFLLRPIAGAEL